MTTKLMLDLPLMKVRAQKQRIMGDFRLHDIPPSPKGVPIFNIRSQSDDIDANGILNVSVEDLTSQKKEITLTMDTTSGLVHIKVE
ncbi:hypothetical protein ACFXTI_014695 [Malus domestica]